MITVTAKHISKCFSGSVIPAHIWDTGKLRLRLVASLEEGELPRRLWRITDVAARGPHSIQGRRLLCSRESMGVKTAQAIWSWRCRSQLDRARISHPA